MLHISNFGSCFQFELDETSETWNRHDIRPSENNSVPFGRPDHYENLPMQYTEIFFGCKNENFHWKNFDIFLIFAQNIDCGYTLEPPRRGGSNE